MRVYCPEVFIRRNADAVELSEIGNGGFERRFVISRSPHCAALDGSLHLALDRQHRTVSLNQDALSDASHQ